MAEGDEDKSSIPKDSSSGSISRAKHTPNQPNHQNSNKPNDGRRRNRPGRAEREKLGRKQTAESSAPISGSSHLNPSAPNFVPRQPTASVYVAGEPVNNGVATVENRSNNRRRRGGRRGGIHQQQTNGEGAEKTSENPSPQTGGAAPSQPQARRNPNARARVLPQEQQKVLKESEDLMVRMTEALNKGDYDCSICTDRITRYKPVWYCKVCWTVFHRSCIKKWAAHSLGEGIVWRCPGCQSPSETVPNEYRCWCGKVENPEVDRLATPHSCTQPCLRKRNSGCACTLPCHPGPCPPCYQVHMPPQTCFCGKDTRLVRCCDYNPDLPGWSCGQPCSTPLNCNAAEVAFSDDKMKRHICQVSCHQGPCPPCQIQETISCYCGKHSKEVVCSDKEFPKQSQAKEDDEMTSWLGFYQCGDICGRKFDCGIHECKKRCHPQDAQTIQCPKSPEQVKFCPCGKTPVGELAERKTCQDPIPTCTKLCEKLLSCGHDCQSTCHLDDCPPCQLVITTRCRCGQTTFKLSCHEAGSKELLCERMCASMKSCGRHHCGARCCSGDHLCTKVCGRALKCGSHNCTVLCHRGPCPPCLEASFEPLICTCGKTEIPPPVRCGTAPPQCPHPCIIEPPCGHPKVSHSCHPPDEPCPKCPYLVEKTCMCGKRSVKNQPCFRAQAGGVSCGMACGALMPCGFHRCQSSCHRHTNEGIKCTEKCGKPRKSCGHACPLKCHSPSACDESTPCQAPVVVRCDCGLRKQEVTCQATSAEPSRGLKNLPCTDLCARTERNRRLAEALDIDTTASFHEPENMKGGYELKTLEFYNNNKIWCLEVENIFREFLSGNNMRHAFKPMPGRKREFVHELAQAYALDAESIDHEPYRSVEIYRNNRAALPRYTLAEASKLKSPHGTSASTYAASGLVQMRKNTPGVAYNAIYFEGVKGTVLQADLQMALNPILRPSKLLFSMKWINNGKDVLLQPGATTLPIEDVEAGLHKVVKQVRQYVSSSGVADKVELCWVNREGNVSYRESTRQLSKKPSEPPAAPWSKFMPPKVEMSNTYDALSGVGGVASRPRSSTPTTLSASARKVRQQELPVLEDWESFEG